MSCNPSSSTHCSSGSQNKETFPLENNEDRNRESAGHQELIPICNKFQFGNPQMKGFTISTISDVYHRSGAEIITCFSIFDANLEDFCDGCALTFPNIVRDKICEKDITTILNFRNHGVLDGTYHEGGIPRENEHRSLTIYNIYDEIKKIVRKNTNWRKWGVEDDEEWDDVDRWVGFWDDEEFEENSSSDDEEYQGEEELSYTIHDDNNIPVLFYTDDFIDLEQGNEISFRNVPINFIIGKYFIAIPLYINDTFRGYAVAQKKLWNMAGYQAGVAIFTTGSSWNTSKDTMDYRKTLAIEKFDDPHGHPPYLVGNYNICSICKTCGKDCLGDGYDCAIFSGKYYRPR
uniref:Uncharacterized protein n=1 Tax=Cacopsylla melanoneura TaxID=428564 RepID=A0A8D9AES8_9HEMI